MNKFLIILILLCLTTNIMKTSTQEAKKEKVFMKNFQQQQYLKKIDDKRPYEDKDNKNYTPFALFPLVDKTLIEYTEENQQIREYYAFMFEQWTQDMFLINQILDHPLNKIMGLQRNSSVMAVIQMIGFGSILIISQWKALDEELNSFIKPQKIYYGIKSAFTRKLDMNFKLQNKININGTRKDIQQVLLYITDYLHMMMHTQLYIYSIKDSSYYILIEAAMRPWMISVIRMVLGDFIYAQSTLSVLKNAWGNQFYIIALGRMFIDSQTNHGLDQAAWKDFEVHVDPGEMRYQDFKNEAKLTQKHVQEIADLQNWKLKKYYNNIMDLNKGIFRLVKKLEKLPNEPLNVKNRNRLRQAILGMVQLEKFDPNANKDGQDPPMSQVDEFEYNFKKFNEELTRDERQKSYNRLESLRDLSIKELTSHQIRQIQSRSDHREINCEGYSKVPHQEQVSPKKDTVSNKFMQQINSFKNQSLRSIKQNSINLKESTKDISNNIRNSNINLSNVKDKNIYIKNKRPISTDDNVELNLFGKDEIQCSKHNCSQLQKNHEMSQTDPSDKVKVVARPRNPEVEWLSNDQLRQDLEKHFAVDEADKVVNNPLLKDGNKSKPKEKEEHQNPIDVLDECYHYKFNLVPYKRIEEDMMNISKDFETKASVILENIDQESEWSDEKRTLATELATSLTQLKLNLDHFITDLQNQVQYCQSKSIGYVLDMPQLQFTSYFIKGLQCGFAQNIKKQTKDKAINEKIKRWRKKVLVRLTIFILSTVWLKILKPSAKSYEFYSSKMSQLVTINQVKGIVQILGQSWVVLTSWEYETVLMTFWYWWDNILFVLVLIECLFIQSQPEDPKMLTLIINWEVRRYRNEI